MMKTLSGVPAASSREPSAWEKTKKKTGAPEPRHAGPHRLATGPGVRDGGAWGNWGYLFLT